jgi:hypothetical protein
MIGIAFNMYDLWGCIFGFVAKSVNDYATAYRTIWTGAASLGRARDSKSLCLRVDRREIETEGRPSDSPDKTDLDESSPRDFHVMCPPLIERFEAFELSHRPIQWRSADPGNLIGARIQAVRLSKKDPGI